MMVAGREVLVVDDDLSILHLFTRVLSKEGYAVSSTTNPREALSMVVARTFDLVICDINMPEVNGIEIIKSLREHDEDTSAVIVTAAPNVGSAVAALELGAVRYLTKPISVDRIREVTRDACLTSMERRKRHAAGDEADRAVRARDALAARFSRAMENLNIVYQPIVRPATRTVFAYELLCRSNRVFDNPLELIDAADVLGRERELREALRSKSASLPHDFPAEANIFVNIAPDELLDETMYLSSNPLTAIAKRIVLEITERTSIADIPDITQRIRALKARGFRIAIDDLGAGYAGLSSFALLEPNVVKIDMSLVRDVHKLPVNARIVRSIIEAARDLRAEVICEGVETRDERDVLASLGCDLFQGYLYARPGPIGSVRWD